MTTYTITDANDAITIRDKTGGIVHSLPAVADVTLSVTGFKFFSQRVRRQLLQLFTEPVINAGFIRISNDIHERYWRVISLFAPNLRGLSCGSAVRWHVFGEGMLGVLCAARALRVFEFRGRSTAGLRTAIVKTLNARRRTWDRITLNVNLGEEGWDRLGPSVSDLTIILPRSSIVGDINWARLECDTLRVHGNVGAVLSSMLRSRSDFDDPTVHLIVSFIVDARRADEVSTDRLHRDGIRTEVFPDVLEGVDRRLSNVARRLTVQVEIQEEPGGHPKTRAVAFWIARQLTPVSRAMEGRVELDLAVVSSVSGYRPGAVDKRVIAHGLPAEHISVAVEPE